MKLLHVQIAAAALLAPVAVSFASPAQPVAAPKATPVAQVAAPATLPAAKPAATTVSVEAVAPGCAVPKVRVVYSGYAPSAPKGC